MCKNRKEITNRVMMFQACNAYSNLSLAEKPTLFLEFHSSADGLDSQTEMVRDIADANGGSDFEWATLQVAHTHILKISNNIKFCFVKLWRLFSFQEDRSRLWTARHKLYYAGINMKPGCRSVTTDACVPVSKLPEMIDQTRADIDSMGITGTNHANLLPN